MHALTGLTMNCDVRPRKVRRSFPDSEGGRISWAAERRTSVMSPGFDPALTAHSLMRFWEYPNWMSFWLAAQTSGGISCGI